MFFLCLQVFFTNLLIKGEINEGLKKCVTAIESVKRMLILTEKNRPFRNGKEARVGCKSAGAGQMSIHLERLMKQHGQTQTYPSERILELNPRHSLIKKLAQNILEKKDEEIIQNAVWLLYDQARAIEGEPIKDTSAFAERLNLFMEKGL